MSNTINDAVNSQGSVMSGEIFEHVDTVDRLRFWWISRCQTENKLSLSVSFGSGDLAIHDVTVTTPASLYSGIETNRRATL